MNLKKKKKQLTPRWWPKWKKRMKKKKKKTKRNGDNTYVGADIVVKI